MQKKNWTGRTIGWGDSIMHGFVHTSSRNYNWHNSTTLFSTWKLVRHFDRVFLSSEKVKDKKKNLIYIYISGILGLEQVQVGPWHRTGKLFLHTRRYGVWVMLSKEDDLRWEVRVKKGEKKIEVSALVEEIILSKKQNKTKTRGQMTHHHTWETLWCTNNIWFL